MLDLFLNSMQGFTNDWEHRYLTSSFINCQIVNICFLFLTEFIYLAGFDSTPLNII